MLSAAEVSCLRDMDPVAIGDAISAIGRGGSPFMGDTARSKPLSDATRSTYIVRMRSFARWLVKARRVQQNPLEALEGVDGHTAAIVRRRRALTRDEMGRLLHAALSRPEAELRLIRRGKRKGQLVANPSMEQVTRAKRLGLERRTAYLLAVLTGLRRGEIEQLRWSDVLLNQDPPIVQLRKEATKSRRADWVPIHPQLKHALDTWRQVQQASGTASGGSEASVFGVVPGIAVLKRDLAWAGIPFEVPGRGVADLHALRKTYSTFMAAASIPQRVRQAAMRHRDPRLTEGAYMDEDILPVHTLVSAMESIPEIPPKGAS